MSKCLWVEANKLMIKELGQLLKRDLNNKVSKEKLMSSKLK